jgi:hypothetical protein
MSQSPSSFSKAGLLAKSAVGELSSVVDIACINLLRVKCLTLNASSSDGGVRLTKHLWLKGMDTVSPEVVVRRYRLVHITEGRRQTLWRVGMRAIGFARDQKFDNSLPFSTAKYTAGPFDVRVQVTVPFARFPRPHASKCLALVMLDPRPAPISKEHALNTLYAVLPATVCTQCVCCTRVWESVHGCPRLLVDIGSDSRVGCALLACRRARQL